MPVRILLIGAVVFLAAWFTVLRPSRAVRADERPPSRATSQTGLGKAVDAAKKAAASRPAATPAATRRRHRDDDRARRRARAAAIAIPAEALAKLPKDVAGALKARKMLVLGVFADGAPSRGARWPTTTATSATPSSKTNRYDGEVVRQAGRRSQALDLRPAGQRPRRQPVARASSSSTRNLKGTRPHRLRRPHRHQPGDRRRPPRQHRPEHHRRLPARGQRDLRATSSCASTRWSRPTIRGKKAATPPLDRAARDRPTATAARSARSHAPAKWRGLKAEWLNGIMTDDGASTATRQGRQDRATPRTSVATDALRPRRALAHARPPLQRGRRSPTASINRRS